MKKKLLLLSVAVATVFTVNAQSSSRVGLTPKVNPNESNLIETGINFNGMDLTSKRTSYQSTKGTYTLTDTSKQVDYKRAYGNGNYYSGTSQYSNNIGYKLKVTNAVSPATGVNVPVLMQTYPLDYPATLTKIGVVLRSLNTTSADIDLRVYDKNFNEIGYKKLTVAYNANYAVQYFVFDSPIALTDTFNVEVSSYAEKDSLRVLTTGYYTSGMGTGSIAGSTLTVSAWTAYKGGFLVGKPITGTGVAANTQVTAQTGYMTYSVNNSQTVASTTITGEKYNFGGLLNTTLYVWNYPTSGNATPTPYYLFTDNSNPVETDLFMYPVLQYSINNTPTVDNHCLGTNNTVNVSLNYEKFQKNPLLSKLAFYINYLGKSKANGDYYYSSIAYKSDVNDTAWIDNSASVWGDSKTYTTPVVDTITVADFFWNYGIGGNPNQFIVDETKIAIGVNASASAGGNTTITSAQTATVTGAAAANGTIQWTENGAGSITAGATTLTPTYTPAVGDEGNAVLLTMTVTGAAPCAAQVQATYTVNVTTTTSVDENGVALLSVYPNPANNVVNIANLASNSNVTMMNSLGQVVYSAVASDKLSINTENLTEGVYFVRVNNQVVKVILSK